LGEVWERMRGERMRGERIAEAAAVVGCRAAGVIE